MILSNSQSAATLWVLDTCLIVGLLPLMIILITASLSSKCRASHRIEKTSQSTKHNLAWFWVCLFDGVSRNKFPMFSIFVFFLKKIA